MKGCIIRGERVVKRMATTEAQRRATMKYKEKAYRRIPLDVRKEYYEEIAKAAEAAGESVNGYIKKAIEERMQREAGQ